jgi:biopolymer transport protein ExbD
MAGFSGAKANAPITGINVTPLVDITLVLLIIFMVTAKLVVSNAIPMDLPKAATGGEVQQIFSVSLATDGRISVDGVAVTSDEDLLGRAKASLQRSPELRAVIQADGQVPHRDVMRTLDVLRQAGLSRIAFGVSPIEPLSPGSASAAPAIPAAAAAIAAAADPVPAIPAPNSGSGAP